MSCPLWLTGTHTVATVALCFLYVCLRLSVLRVLCYFIFPYGFLYLAALLPYGFPSVP